MTVGRVVIELEALHSPGLGVPGLLGSAEAHSHRRGHTVMDGRANAIQSPGFSVIRTA